MGKGKQVETVPYEVLLILKEFVPMSVQFFWEGEDGTVAWQIGTHRQNSRIELNKT